MNAGTRVLVSTMGEDLPAIYVGPSGYVDYAGRDMPAVRLDRDGSTTLVAWSQVRAS